MMTSVRPSKLSLLEGSLLAAASPSSNVISPVRAGGGMQDDSSSSTRNSNNSCYLVTVGLCAHVHAENAQAAAVAAVDAAAGATTDSPPSQAAQIGSLCICSVPTEKHSQQVKYHHEQHNHQQHERSASQQHLQQPQHQQTRPTYCAIHVDSTHGGCTGRDVADAAATEAVIGAVARAAAAEVSFGVSGAADACSQSPQRCSLCLAGGASRSELHGVVGMDMPDLKTVPVAIRVPSYGEHFIYEVKKLRRFWRFDLHQRDWRQILVCSYFPNVIDPLLLTLLRLCCCICVGALEILSSIQGVQETGGSHALYFTNWNSVMVAAGFLSLTITSIIACKSFAAPLHQKSSQDDSWRQQRVEEQGQQPQQQHSAPHPTTDLLMKPMEDATSPMQSQQQQQQHVSQCRAHSREVSSSSLGFSPLEFVAINDNLPHPTYSSNKAGLLPRLVQLRQQLLQQQQQPRDTRTLCLVLPGYRDLMADSRYCIEGILLAPNPSNRAKPKHPKSPQQQSKWYSWLCCMWKKAPKTLTSPCVSESAAASAAATAQSAVAASSSSAAIPPSSQTPTAGDTPADESRSSVDFSSATLTAAAPSAGGAEAPMPWFVKVTWVLHNLQLVASLGVFAVFFSLFKSEEKALPWTWITIWKHAVLVMLTLLHASLLSRIPCPLRHVGYTLLLFVAYFSLQVCVYIFKLSNGQGGVGYVYKVFSLAEPGKAVVVLAGVLLCCLFMHLFLWSISRKRCLYVDPPLSVSVTALQLRRSIRYAAAAAAAAAAAERMASESAAAAEPASQDNMIKPQQRHSQYSTEEIYVDNQLSSSSSSRNSSYNQNGPCAGQNQQQEQQQHHPQANIVGDAQA